MSTQCLSESGQVLLPLEVQGRGWELPEHRPGVSREGPAGRNLAQDLQIPMESKGSSFRIAIGVCGRGRRRKFQAALLAPTLLVDSLKGPRVGVP